MGEILTTGLLEHLEQSGFTVVLDPPDGILVAPAEELTTEMRATIRANKAGILDALVRKAKRTSSKQNARLCGICGSQQFWERSLESGVGLVCAVCHPNPLAEWQRRAADADVPIVLTERRSWLLEWGLANHCPELRFRRWASIAGTAHAWHEFVLSASAEDIEAEALAAGEWERN
jgi:hypothetical protein